MHYDSKWTYKMFIMSNRIIRIKSCLSWALVRMQSIIHTLAVCYYHCLYWDAASCTKKFWPISTSPIFTVTFSSDNLFSEYFDKTIICHIFPLLLIVKMPTQACEIFKSGLAYFENKLQDGFITSTKESTLSCYNVSI